MTISRWSKTWGSVSRAWLRLFLKSFNYHWSETQQRIRTRPKMSVGGSVRLRPLSSTTGPNYYFLGWAPALQTAQNSHSPARKGQIRDPLPFPASPPLSPLHQKLHFKRGRRATLYPPKCRKTNRRKREERIDGGNPTRLHHEPLP